MNTQVSFCPCGSNLALTECCHRYLGGIPAPTPEALMRSRYTAYSIHAMDYLKATWAPETRPLQLTPDPSVRWARLQVIGASEHGNEGTVEFRAFYQSNASWNELHETSRFRKSDGRWYYVEGDALWTVLSPGRNDPCPCDSGRKFKKCCAD